MYLDNDGFFMIQTPLCRVVSMDDQGLWLEPPKDFCDVINHVDISYISQSSSDIHTYLAYLKGFTTSLKLAPHGDSYYIYINKRNYTKTYGTICVNDTVQVILNCNYTKQRLIWSAYQIKNSIIETKPDALFQDCHISEPELIQI